MSEEIRQRVLGLDALEQMKQWSRNGTAPLDRSVEPSAQPGTARVELVGLHLRVAGAVETGDFSRLSDIVNLRESVELTDAVLLAGLGQETRIVFPELRVRLADISIIGQREGGPPAANGHHRIPRARRHLAVMTVAHMIYGWAYLHPEATLAAFVDSVDQRFMPMTDVHVRWLPDRRLAARYPFALVQRSHVIGVASEAPGRSAAATEANSRVGETLGFD
jgi:hypothetical protein